MHKGEGSAPLDLFIDNKSPVEISVFILDFAPDDNLTKIGDDMARQRGPNRKFYGWAELSVTNARKDKREVRSTPQPKNKWHADIVLPPTAETDKKERERHAIQLAKMAVPRPCDR